MSIMNIATFIINTLGGGGTKILLLWRFPSSTRSSFW